MPDPVVAADLLTPEAPKPPLLKTLRRILAFARPYRTRLVLAIVLKLLSTAVGLVVPLGLKALLDSVFQSSDGSLLDTLAVALLGLFLVQALLGFGGGYRNEEWLGTTVTLARSATGGSGRAWSAPPMGRDAKVKIGPYGSESDAITLALGPYNPRLHADETLDRLASHERLRLLAPHERLRLLAPSKRLCCVSRVSRNLFCRAESGFSCSSGRRVVHFGRARNPERDTCLICSDASR